MQRKANFARLNNRSVTEPTKALSVGYQLASADDFLNEVSRAEATEQITATPLQGWVCDACAVDCEDGMKTAARLAVACPDPCRSISA